jgi:hypothetical protein
VIQQFIAQKTGGADVFIGNVKTWTGVDLDTVRTCWIGVQKKDHAIIVLQGEFSEQAIESAVLNIDTAQVVQRPGVPFTVMLPDDKRPGEYNLAGVLDEKTIVLGLPELVDDFLAVYTGAQPVADAARAKRIAAISTSEAMLDAVVLEVPEAELRKNPWMGLFSAATITADLDKDLELGLRLAVKDPEIADPIRKLVEGFRDVYSHLEPPQRKLPRIVEVLLKNAAVAVDQGDVVVDVTIPTATFEQMAQQKLLRQP